MPISRKPGKPLIETGAGFAQLQRGLTGERSLIGESYMDNYAMLTAYLDYYWPVSRAQAAHAISVGFRSFPVCKKVIDIGSGPGPVAAAFIDAGAEHLLLVDQSRKALDIALRELPQRCARSAHLSTLVADIGVLDPEKLSLWGSADCISFGHSLNEIFAGENDRIEKRARLLEQYSKGLATGGTILIIEPALLSTSRELLVLRNILVQRGWSVCSPCKGRETLFCPAVEAGENHTCHEEVFWKIPQKTAALARTMKIDKESLKMTWLLLAPPKKTEDALREHTENKNNDIYRVVSDPMLNKAGRVRRLICGVKGRFPLSAVDGGSDANRCSFADLKRGEFIRVENPEERENGWGIGPYTRIIREGVKR